MRSNVLALFDYFLKIYRYIIESKVLICKIPTNRIASFPESSYLAYYITSRSNYKIVPTTSPSSS